MSNTSVEILSQRGIQPRKTATRVRNAKKRWRGSRHFGDKDNAIAALQHLLNIPCGPPPVTPALLRIDPDWDNLRDDPRFQKLVASPAPKAPDK